MFRRRRDRARDALARGSSVTFAAFQNFGNTPGLDAFCRAHGLTWHRSRAAQVGQFGAGLEYWRPGLAAALGKAADDGGAPMMTLAALRRCHQGGPTLADLIDRLGLADATTIPLLSLAADSARSGPVRPRGPLQSRRGASPV